MRRPTCVLIAAAVVVAASWAASPNRARRHFAALGNDQLLEGLSSADRAVREQTYTTWREARDQQIDDLIALVRRRPVQTDFYATRELASKMLGDLHAPNAIAVLIEHVEYEQKLRIETEFWPLNSYPCAAALWAIDLNAIAEILWHLARTDSKRVSNKSLDLFAEIIGEVYGYQTGANGGLAEALAMIERFTARQPEASRANLDALLQRVRMKKRSIDE